MIDLSFSILFSSLIFVIFKLYRRFHIHTLHAIIINYLTACSVGLILYKGKFNITTVVSESWFTGSVLLGVLFILIFNLMARTSQQLGVSVASVATKMSLVIPVILGIWLYKETLGLVRIIGIILALAAVYFASVRESKLELRYRNLYLPLLVFLGSGVIDGSIKYFEEFHLSSGEYPVFSSMIFAAAALSGLVFVAFKDIKTFKAWTWRDILGGLALGVPNFFSIYFLLRALKTPVLNSASIFTINNVAIVMFSTLLGIVIFQEKLSRLNWAGIAMAVISIVLVAAG